MGQGAHGVYYIYSVLDWQQAGISAATIGWLWAAGVIAETLLLLGPGRALVARIGPSRALALAAGAGILRWGLMAMGPDLPWLWPLQAMHALTFAVAHLGATAFIAKAIPPRMAASAQGVLSGVIGGSVTGGTLFLAALLTQQAGIGAAYMMAAAVAGAAALCALILGWMWRGERLVPEPANS
ncbi:MAG: MFS transporter [Pseudomonadota bacterium]